jgi:hypothetical protein
MLWSARTTSGDAQGVSLKEESGRSARALKLDAEVSASGASSSVLPRQDRNTDAPEYFYVPDMRGMGPEYTSAFKKHIALRTYLRSRARETPECQAILKVLKDHGYGVEALPAAYWAAMNYHRYDTNQTWDKVIIGNEDYESVNPKHVTTFNQLREQQQQRTRRREEKGLSQRFGMTNAVLLDAIFSVRPKVPFGLPELGHGLSLGDRFLKESDFPELRP